MTVPDGTPPVPGVEAPASLAVVWLRCAARSVHERRQWLTDLDAAIGDGDHGINLDRGFSALVEDLDAGRLPVDDLGALLTGAGRRLLAVVGGASGALYGRGLMTAGARITGCGFGPDAGRREVAEVALAGSIEGIVGLGRAVPGDKTMLDALAPALEALRAAPADLAGDGVMAAVARAADDGARATIPLVARKGRASYLGERSAGHLDPGAASCALLVRCFADAVARTTAGD